MLSRLVRALPRRFAARFSTQVQHKPLVAPTILKPVEHKAHLQEFATMLAERVFPKHIHRIFLRGNDLVICTTPDALIPVLSFLRDHSHTQFKQLTDIAVVDWPEHEHRFSVDYLLLSYRFNVRARVRTRTSEILPLPTVTTLFKSADWQEREAWDMFGITFSGHPDLRRILTDYGFEGHPLRKDFPLSGFHEVRYDDTSKQIVYDSLELAQKFRRFQFPSPWLQLAPEVRNQQKLAGQGLVK